MESDEVLAATKAFLIDVVAVNTKAPEQYLAQYKPLEKYLGGVANSVAGKVIALAYHTLYDAILYLYHYYYHYH